MPIPLVIGVDAGATTTRCVVSTIDGTVLSRGRAGGANQNSSAGRPADALTAALSSALSTVDPSAVASGVIGTAGAAAAGRAEARAAAEEAWHTVGLPGSVSSVTDIETAFAAGTPSPEGLLLLSGTGAVSAAFVAGAPRMRCDGYGWLLGDEGSAVWLGREALRSVLRALDTRGAPTALTAAVTEALGVQPDDDPEAQAQALLRVAYRQPPAQLGRLAPLVGDIAAKGDLVADELAGVAAQHLLHALDAVARRAGCSGGTTVVLAGSVLLTSGPVAERVRAGVRERFRVRPAEAHDGAAGAAYLAILRLTGRPATHEVHARLTR